MSADDFAARIVIRPEPSEEEAAIIVAALAALSGSQAASQELVPKSRGSQWSLVGRRAAHHSSPHSRKQWSRDPARLERSER